MEQVCSQRLLKALQNISRIRGSAPQRKMLRLLLICFARGEYFGYIALIPSLLPRRPVSATGFGAPPNRKGTMIPAMSEPVIFGKHRKSDGTGKRACRPKTPGSKCVVSLFLISAVIIAFSVAVTPERCGAGGQEVVFTGRDVPDDEGGRIILEWTAPETWSPDRVEIIRGEPDGAEHLVGVIDPELRSTIDDGAVDGVEYTYTLRTWSGGIPSDFEAESTVVSSYQTFNKTKLAKTGVGCLITFILFFFFVNQATRGKEIFIREIAGLSAVEEAVGRATEMGKPILFVPGTSYIEDVATIAGLNILGEIAKKNRRLRNTPDRAEPRPDSLHRSQGDREGVLLLHRPARLV